jgi:glucoamylase
MVRRRRFIPLAASVALLAGLAVTVPAAMVPAASAAGTAATAPGAPGAASYFDLARKDCLGTSAGTGSKVWYTVADGVLSDVYEPSTTPT